MQIPPGFGECLQPRGYVDAIPEDVVLFGDHVAEVDPDAKLDPLIDRGSRIALDHAPLHVDCAPHGIDHARKLDEHSVAGVLDDPAMVFGYLGIDKRAAMRFEAFVRAFFVRPHQTRIARHIGGEDRGEAADRGHFSPGGRLP